MLPKGKGGEEEQTESGIDIDSQLHIKYMGRSLEPQTVKNLSTVEETWVRSLDREDPLEKEMSNYSSTLAWEIP